MFICQLCKQENDGNDETMQQNIMEFDNLDELEAHLASEHFNCLPYECEHCQFAKFPTEFAVMRHNEEDHGNKNYSFRCRITPALKKRREKIQQFLQTTKENAQINSLASVQQNLIAGPSMSRHQTKEISIKNEIPDEIGEEQNGITATLNERLQVACAQKIKQNVQMEGGSISSGNTAAENSLTNGKLYKKTKSNHGMELQLMVGSRTSTVDGEDDGREIEEQFRRQEADVHEILKAAADAASQVGRNARSKIGPYSLRPNRFSPYSFLQQKQRNWQNYFGQVGSKKGPIGASAEDRNSGNVGLKLQFKNEKVVDRIRCRKCGEMVNSTGGCLMHHLNTRHLRLPLFQCRLCKKDFYEVSNTRIHKHMRIHHGGDTQYLVSNYAKYAHALHAGRDETFGTREERMRAIRGERMAEIEKQYGFFGKGKGKQIVQGEINHSPTVDQNCATVRAIFKDEQRNDEEEEREDSTNMAAGLFNKFIRNPSQDDNLSPSPANYANKGEINKNKNFSDENEELDEDGFLEEENREMGGEEMEETNDDGQVIEEHGEDEEFGEDEEGDQPPSTIDINSANTNIALSFQSKKLGGNISAANMQQSSSNFGRETKTGESSAGPGISSRPTGGPFQLMVGRMQMQLGSEDKVPCRLCGEMVLNKLLNRLNHVNVRHLQLPLHQCRLCNKSFTSYSRSACYSHVQFAHKTDLEMGHCSQNIEEHIIYMKEQYSNQLLEAADEYFD